MPLPASATGGWYLVVTVARAAARTAAASVVGTLGGVCTSVVVAVEEAIQIVVDTIEAIAGRHALFAFVFGGFFLA